MTSITIKSSNLDNLVIGSLNAKVSAQGVRIETQEYEPPSRGWRAPRFVSGKPLTSLNGANLLHLLARHGYQAQIDIAAARLART